MIDLVIIFLPIALLIWFIGGLAQWHDNAEKDSELNYLEFRESQYGEDHKDSIDHLRRTLRLPPRTRGDSQNHPFANRD